MSTYSDRRWEVLIDDKQFIAPTGGRQFKAVFEILQDFGGANSYGDISFYNLNTDTANTTFNRGGKLTLRAGYATSIDSIFVGTIKNVLRERRGPDTITRVICRGGKLTDKQAQINETIGSGAKVTDIIRACVKVMGYPIVIDETQFVDVPVYARPAVLSGDPRVKLDELSRVHDFNYVIENDRLIVVKEGFYREGDVHIVSQFTGMEGIPEITEVGADVVMRLNPKIKIGGRYRIESELATFNFSNLYFVDIPESAGKGEYRIFRVAHSGDTWGDVWSTKITGFR